MTKGVSKRASDPNVAVGSYRISPSKKGSVIVVVTSGQLAGKSARLIETPPSAAYFNDKSAKRPT
jgi:hypothetical protein